MKSVFGSTKSAVAKIFGSVFGKKGADQETGNPADNKINPKSTFAPGSDPGLGPYTSMSSSNVDKARYDWVHQQLYVNYKGNREYRYGNVNPAEAQSFYDSGSKGGWVWDNLRQRGSQYDHKKPYVPVGQLLANGGEVQQRVGRPGVDSEPVTATPGEYMVNAVQARKNRAALDYINGGGDLNLSEIMQDSHIQGIGIRGNRRYPKGPSDLIRQIPGLGGLGGHYQGERLREGGEGGVKLGEAAEKLLQAADKLSSLVDRALLSMMSSSSVTGRSSSSRNRRKPGRGMFKRSYDIEAYSEETEEIPDAELVSNPPEEYGPRPKASKWEDVPSYKDMFPGLGGFWGGGGSGAFANQKGNKGVSMAAAGPEGAIFEGLKNNADAVRKAFEDLIAFGINPTKRIMETLAPILDQVEKFDPASVMMFNLAMDNLSASVGRFLEPIVGAATEFADGLNEVMSGLGPSLSQSVKSMLGAFMPALTAWIEGAMNQVAVVFEALQPIFDTLGEVSSAFGEVITEIQDAMIPIIREVIEAFSDVLVPAIHLVADALRGLVVILRAMGMGGNMAPHGEMTFAAQQARMIGIPAAGEQARVAAFSQGRSLQEQTNGLLEEGNNINTNGFESLNRWLEIWLAGQNANQAGANATVPAGGN